MSPLLMAMFPNTLSTDRLFLRRLTPDDADDVFAYACDPDVAHFMTFPRAKSVDDVLPFLNGIQELMDADSEFHWGIEVTGTPGVIGVIGFRRVHGLEMGYVLNRRQWGCGYMPEAARALIGWGFEIDGASRVWATCDLENVKSATVMRKAGMTEEGCLRRWAIHPNLSETPRDCLVFSTVR